MQVEVRQIEPPEVEVDLVVIGLYDGEDLPAEIAARPRGGRRQGAFKSSPASTPATGPAAGRRAGQPARD